MKSILRSKRAQFFSLYLVFLTLFMIFLSFYLYSLQNNKLQTSLINYEEISKLKVQQKAFEINEKDVLISSIKEAKSILGEGSWGSKEFLDKTQEIFLSEAIKPEKEYLFNFIERDLIFQGIKLDSSVFDDVTSKKNFLILVYSFEFIDLNNEKVMKITRSFDKTFVLQGDKSKVNFAVEVYYTLNKEYNITKSDI